MPRGLKDAVMRWFGKIPRHCRFCEKRFYVLPGSDEPEFPESL
jgi:hypothetical protein